MPLRLGRRSRQLQEYGRAAQVLLHLLGQAVRHGAHFIHRVVVVDQQRFLGAYGAALAVTHGGGHPSQVLRHDRRIEYYHFVLNDE